MDATQISGMGKRLAKFLVKLDDCFGRSEPREHLRTYVRGQLSGLHRKSVEPMALSAGTPPRTLQRLLESMRWDEVRLRDRLQRIVAQDHSHEQAIGIIDDSGHPKQGRHTAGVQRQWCGNRGKVDNCVVTVHTGYVVDDFQCLLDSDVYLPQSWAEDRQRCEAAYIPDDVVYRKKTDIALDQIRRSLTHGVRVSAWTFDEWYGRDGSFLDDLEAIGQNYVGEVPANFVGWVHEPQILQRPTPQETCQRGRKRHYPRLARKALPACEVGNLSTYSPMFHKQKWCRYHIKDGERGPMVWEVRHARFYRKHSDGLPGRPHWLIVVRNVLNPDETKYFISNLPPETSLQWLLWVAFSRWPIERCFQQAKDELGMDHFEVRSWRAIHRHLYISQLSHLFCSRVHQALREKKDGHRILDRRTGSGRRIDVGRSEKPVTFRSTKEICASRRSNQLLPTSQPSSTGLAQKNDAPADATTRYFRRSVDLLCAG